MYDREIGVKQDLMNRLNLLRNELRTLESNEGANKWKTKFSEVFDMCQGLVIENTSLQ